jgi:rubrerythrin
MDLLALLLLLIPLAALVRVVKRIRLARRRVRESRERIFRDGMICARCGYNMRASPQQCSECGCRPHDSCVRQVLQKG